MENRPTSSFTIPEEKAIVVTMPDATRWKVPFEVIARKFAYYNAGLNTGEYDGYFFNASFKEELRFAQTHEAQTLAWARQTVQWFELREHAKQVITPETAVDYQNSWMQGELTVIGS